MAKNTSQASGEGSSDAKAPVLSQAEASAILSRLDALEERVGLLHDGESESARTHVWVLIESWTRACGAVNRLSELSTQARALSLRNMGRIPAELVDFLREVGKLT